MDKGDGGLAMQVLGICHTPTKTGTFLRMGFKHGYTFK